MNIEVNVIYINTSQEGIYEMTLKNLNWSEEENEKALEQSEKRKMEIKDLQPNL